MVSSVQYDGADPRYIAFVFLNGLVASHILLPVSSSDWRLVVGVQLRGRVHKTR